MRAVKWLLFTIFSVCTLILLVLPFLNAGEKLLWQKEYYKPVDFYADPDLRYFIEVPRHDKYAVFRGTGVVVYGQDGSKLWGYDKGVFHAVSWYSKVVVARKVDPFAMETLLNEIHALEQPEQREADNDPLDRLEYSYVFIDLDTGKVLREFTGNKEAVVDINLLPLFREPGYIKDSWRQNIPMRYKISDITRDGIYVKAYDSSAQTFDCKVYKRPNMPGDSWATAGNCLGGELVSGGNWLYGENIIPTTPEKLEEFTQNGIIKAKAGLRTLDDKSIWTREITIHHNLSEHFLLDYPIAWHSNARVAVYAGVTIKVMNMAGNELGEVPYAGTIEEAKMLENRYPPVNAPRLAFSNDRTYLKFYCQDTGDDEVVKKRTIKLYTGELILKAPYP